MELPTEVSRRFRGLAVVCCLLVVLNHAHNLHAGIHSEGILGISVVWLQNLLSSGLARISTPFFFMTAAYLLFHGAASAWGSYRSRLRKRWGTLAVPFLCWSVLGLTSVVAMQAGGWSGSGRFSIASSTPVQWLDALLWDPIPYQLWFLRSLFLLCVLSPLIHLLIRWRLCAGLLIIVLGAIWFAWPVVRETRAAFFFCLGAVAAVHGLRVPALSGVVVAFLAGGWILAALVNTATVLEQGRMHPVALNASILLGLSTLWTGYPWLAPVLDRPRVQLFAGYTFFVYASHEPFESMLGTVLTAALGHAPSSLLAAYAMTACGTFAVCICLALALERYLPRAFHLLAGGRGSRPAVIAAPRAALPGSGTSRPDPAAHPSPVDPMPSTACDTRIAAPEGSPRPMAGRGADHD